MTSSRCSERAIAALVVALVVAAGVGAAGATAVPDENVQGTQVPDEAAVGTSVSGVFSLTGNLYNDPEWEAWLLRLETELTNVTWTVTYLDVSGQTIDQFSVDGTNVTVSDRPIAKDSAAYDSTIAQVRVKVSGTVPAVEQYSYESREQLLLARLVQVRQGGSSSELGTWRAYHFTDGSGEEPGSRTARTAIDDARAAVDNASAAGADVAEARSTLNSSIDAYNSGEFTLATDLANQARSEAVEARESKEAAQQRGQLLLFGGLGLVVLVLAGGGVWYWRNQRDTYDKLG